MRQTDLIHGRIQTKISEGFWVYYKGAEDTPKAARRWGMPLHHGLHSLGIEEEKIHFAQKFGHLVMMFSIGVFQDV